MSHELEEDQPIQKLDFRLWMRVFAFARPYRKHAAVLGLLAILVAACDVALPVFTGAIINEIQKRGSDVRIAPWAVAYLATFTTLAMCIFGFIVLAGRIVTSVSHDIRDAAFSKLQALPFSYFDRRAVGWLMARLTSDCNNLSRIMGWALLDIVWGTTLLIVLTTVMFYINWKLALVVLAIAPPLLLVSRFFQVRLLKTSRALRKANSITTGAFNEGIQGVKTTKSLVREQRNSEEFAELTGNMYRHAVSNQLYHALFLPIVSTICSFGVGLALWAGGADVLLGAIQLGTMVMFLQFAQRMVDPAQELANTFTMIQSAQASAERIQGLLDEPLEIEDSPAVRQRLEQYATENRPRSVAIDGHETAIRTIEFRNVSFAYKQGQKVLDNFNLTVHAGETIALVGPTGGGKTTIVALLCRFYEPTSGQILINGRDYRERSLHWLQSNLGMVLQQPHLFSGTIRENIRYGRLDATDAEVEQAAVLTNAHEFVQRLPGAYEATIGEGGNQLSTGQKQLVSLARAVLADPQIFVMDEATSSVDTETERKIQGAVERVLENRISFVIAHRLSTIRNADRILVIDAGQIAEQGSHHELIALRGRYFELYTNQFTHEHEDQLLRGDSAAGANGADSAPAVAPA